MSAWRNKFYLLVPKISHICACLFDSQHSTVEEIFCMFARPLDPSTRAHLGKQTRWREDEISFKSRPLDNEFAGREIEVLVLMSE